MRRHQLLAAAAAVCAGTMTLQAGVLDAHAATPTTWLPNGRGLTPAGITVTSTDFPAGVALVPGGRLIVAGSGEQHQDLGSLDPATLSGTYQPAVNGGGTTVALSGTLALSPDGATVYAAGAGGGAAYAFTTGATPSYQATYALPDGRYAGAVAADPTGSWLFVTEPFDTANQPFQRGHRVTRFDLATGATQQADVGELPFHVASATLPSGEVVAAVGDLGGNAVSVLDAATMRVVATVPVGRQPADLAFTHDGSHLLVVSSLDDRLDDIDTATWKVASSLAVSPPGVGIGSGPDGIAVSSDGSRVYTAATEDNAVVVVNRTPAGALSVAGRIPTAWWPTGVALDESTGALLVTAGKGEDLAAATPSGIDAGTAPTDNPGPIGVQNPEGAVERIPLPGDTELAADSAQVAGNNAWSAPATAAQVCGPAAITHVVVVIRENKTFDEELGDEPTGGDPQLTIYGRQVTPNTHALAERFGLFTAFYDDEEVSDIGHPALSSGVTSNWMERMVLQNYAGIEPVEYSNYGSDATGAGYNDDSVQWGPADYLIDDALTNGKRFLDFGYSYRTSPDNIGEALTPAEEAGVVRSFPGYGFNLGVKDQDRAAFWSARWNRDVSAGTLPPLEVVYLPDDHTSVGTNGTPADEVADNDLATGQIVDTVSHSSAWGSTAVVVEEDDPQSGVDHVEEHRSLALVVSPWTVQNGVSSVHHDQTSLLRMTESLLGLPPLTEVDATAPPLPEIWASTPSLQPYSAITPTVPATSPATQAAAHAYAVQRVGTHPALLNISPSVQRDVQWMYARGSTYEPPTTPTVINDPPEQHLQVGPAPAGLCAAPGTSTPEFPGTATTAPLALLALLGIRVVSARRRRRARLTRGR